MTRTVQAIAISVFLIASTSAVNAQDVFVLPASLSGSSNVAVFGVNPFTAAGTFAANTAADLVLAAPNGANYYIISNSGSNTIMTVNSSFTNPQALFSLGSQASAAVISPDGTRLIVGAGSTVQIYNTTTNVSVAGTGLSTTGTVVDVTTNLESTRAFALSVNSSGSQLIAIDLTSYTEIGSVFVSGAATAVSTGPNDLLYVSAPGVIMVIDPRTLSILQQISVSGTPGKMVFTPDGALGLAPNTTPSTGNSVIYVVSLSTESLDFAVSTATTGVPANVTFSQLLPVSGNIVYALSPTNETLYQITLSPLTVNQLAYGIGTTTAAAVSSDIASGSGHPTTQYLFFVSGNTLYEANLGTNASPTQLSLANTAGAVSVAGPVITNGTPATLLTFGNNQNVALLGAGTLPLVVRVVDSQGRPLAGIPVTFSTTATGATLSTSSATSSDNGFAVSWLTSTPSTAGAITVTATAGGLSANFTVNVGSSSGTGTGTSSSGGIAITGGQGEILTEGNTTIANNAPLSVLVTDVNGNPITGATVSFSLTSGGGALLSTNTTTATSATTATGTTDSTGTATVNFEAPSPIEPSNFVTTTVTATTSSGSSVTFYETTIRAQTLGGSQNSPTITLIAPSSGMLSGQAGQTVTGGIQASVIDTISGAGIPDVALQLVNATSTSMNVPSAKCANTFALSNISGVVSCDVVFGGVVGTTQVTPTVGGFTLNPITITVTPGPPGVINILQGNNQSGTPGQQLPLALVAQVTDAFGNVLTGTPVTWTVSPANGVTLSNVSTATDSSGRASVLATLGNTSGPVQVTVTAGTATQTFTLTVNVTVGGIAATSGNNQTALTGAAFGSPLVVTVTDTKGNPVVGATVMFAVTAGSANLGSSTATTNSSGQASTTVTAGTSAGPITITATTGTFSTTFSLTSQLPGPANITVYNGPDFAAGLAVKTISPGGIATITGAGIAPSLQGLVAADNIVGPLPTSLAGVSVTFNGTQAPIYYVQNNNGTQQITVQVPYEVQPGTATVVVNGAAGGSATVMVPVQPYAPAAFTTTVSGQTIAVAERPNGSFVSPTNPALPGENITFFVTGLGQTSSALATGSGGLVNQQVTANLIVGVNNAGVPLISATAAPGLPGVYAVTLQIPANTAAGNAPLSLIAIDSQGNQYWMVSPVIPVQ